jgi:hypothetical protein
MRHNRKQRVSLSVGHFENSQHASPVHSVFTRANAQLSKKVPEVPFDCFVRDTEAEANFLIAQATLK